MIRVLNLIKLLIMELIFIFRGKRGDISQLHKNTLIKNVNRVEATLCDEIGKEIDNAILKNNKNLWIDDQKSDFRIWEFEKIMPKLHKVLEIDKKIKSIENYCGIKVHDWLFMANKVIFKDGNKGSGGGFHRDSCFTRQVKYIWYLDDVGSENGPFCYKQGSNNYTFKDFLSNKFGELRHDWPEDFEEVCGEKGTEIICDTRALHGGKKISKHSRYALTLYTFTKKNKKKEMLRSLGFGID